MHYIPLKRHIIAKHLKSKSEMKPITNKKLRNALSSYKTLISYKDLEAVITLYQVMVNRKENAPKTSFRTSSELRSQADFDFIMDLQETSNYTSDEGRGHKHWTGMAKKTMELIR